MTITNENDMAVTSQAAAAKAAEETAFLMAIRRPRNYAAARLAILESCERPNFAAMAKYKIPIGGKNITGLTIRMAEEALRCWGNMRTKVMCTFENEKVKNIVVGVVDLQTNAGYTDEVSIAKTKEVKKLRPGDEKISERTNTRGELVFLTNCTEQDMLKKTNSAVSKSLRNSTLRLLPADLKEEIENTVTATVGKHIKENLPDEKKKITSAFYKIGVTPETLEEYLGQSIETLSPAQVEDLRGLHAGIKDGHTTWRKVLDEKKEKERPPPASVNLKDLKEVDIVDDEKPPEAELPADKKPKYSLLEMREKIHSEVEKLANPALDYDIACEKALQSISSFVGDDNKIVPGVKNTSQVTTLKSAYVIYGKAKKAVEEAGK